MSVNKTTNANAAACNKHNHGASGGLMTSLSENIRRFSTKTDGAAAVEFVFVVPIMLLMYFGAMEGSQGLETNKKAGRAASIAGDLVAQSEIIKASELVAIANVASATLQPYNRSQPVVDFVGIQITNEQTPRALVVWSRRVKDGKGSRFLTAGSEISIPGTLKIKNTFLIKSELRLSYYPFTTYSKAGMTVSMGEAYHLRPRYTATVKCSDC